MEGLTKKDATEYTCVAQNEHGYINHTFELKVIGKSQVFWRMNSHFNRLKKVYNISKLHFIWNITGVYIYTLMGKFSERLKKKGSCINNIKMPIEKYI